MAQTQISSRLRQDYIDCPNHFNDLGMVNAARLINHFTQIPDLKNESQYCESNTFLPLFDLIEKAKAEEKWASHFCFIHKLSNIKHCFPSVIAKSPVPKFSIEKNITDILFKITHQKNVSCLFIDSKEYNQNLLKYKVGCYILKEKPFCDLKQCPFTILIDNKKNTEIQYEFQSTISYFPQDLKNDSYTWSYFMEMNTYKNSQKILNFTYLKEMLNKEPKSLIHGVGCAEDIEEKSFKRRSLHQCTPLPFIIDTYVENPQNLKVQLYSSKEAINSARLTQWENVFNAVKNYQAIHPLKLWTLYGVF